MLLPSVALLRRVDLAKVIGVALLGKAAGRGHRQVAVELGVPATMVRGWVRRLAERADLGRVRETGRGGLRAKALVAMAGALVGGIVVVEGVRRLAGALPGTLALPAGLLLGGAAPLLLPLLLLPLAALASAVGGGAASAGAEPAPAAGIVGLA